MGGDQTVLGIAVAVVGGLTSVLVARISRTPKDDGGDVRPRTQDLTTIAGLAQEVIRLGDAVAVLTTEQEAQREHSRLQDLTIRALRRYILVLEGALRRLGADVPEPEPADAPLIRVP